MVTPRRQSHAAREASGRTVSTLTQVHAWVRLCWPTRPTASVDDTGWLQTVDGYYVSAVNWILSSAVDALRDNPSRKFTYVEIAYFKRWWDEQDNATQAITRDLVRAGQLTFNLGGWCMPDEAAPTYSAIIDLMTEGHQFILREFGPAARPRVGWSVDPFGHSAGAARLYREMGFVGVLLPCSTDWVFRCG